MIIEEMDRRESLEMLASGRLLRLACVDEGRPYVLPVYLALKTPVTGDPCFYGVTTVGRKIRSMRANPAVCLEVDEVRVQDDWDCVIVEGRFEELARPAGAAPRLARPIILPHSSATGRRSIAPTRTTDWRPTRPWRRRRCGGSSHRPRGKRVPATPRLTDTNPSITGFEPT